MNVERGDVIYQHEWDQLCIVVDERDVYGGYFLLNAQIDRPINTHAYQGFGYRDRCILISKGDFKDSFK